jgi:hypothetical protein
LLVVGMVVEAAAVVDEGEDDELLSLVVVVDMVVEAAAVVDEGEDDELLSSVRWWWTW